MLRVNVTALKNGPMRNVLDLRRTPPARRAASDGRLSDICNRRIGLCCLANALCVEEIEAASPRSGRGERDMKTISRILDVLDRIYDMIGDAFSMTMCAILLIGIFAIAAAGVVLVGGSIVAGLASLVGLI